MSAPAVDYFGLEDIEGFLYMAGGFSLNGGRLGAKPV